jgi:hypothetical protein
MKELNINNIFDFFLLRSYSVEYLLAADLEQTSGWLPMTANSVALRVY